MENYTWVFLGIITLFTVVNSLISLSDRSEEKGEWKGSVNSRLDALEKGLKDILDLFLKRGSPIAGSTSPLTLTELGTEIAEEVSAREWAQNLAGTLITEIIEVIGKHSYEIEEFCFQYTRGEPLLSEEMNQKVKKIAYEKGVTKRDVLDVLALELRDELITRLHK